MMSMAHALVEDKVYVHGLYCYQRLCGVTWHMVMLETMWMFIINAVARTHVEAHDR